MDKKDNSPIFLVEALTIDDNDGDLTNGIFTNYCAIFCLLACGINMFVVGKLITHNSVLSVAGQQSINLNVSRFINFCQSREQASTDITV